jgi:hypothetical protein
LYKHVLAADHLLLIVLAGKYDEIPRDAHGGVAAPAAAAEAEHQVQRGLLLDAVVGERAVILQLLPREDEPLLVRRDACKINGSLGNDFHGRLIHHYEIEL